MEEKRKKFFPQAATQVAAKPTQKTGRSSFQARKIPEFTQGTPASNCISLKEQFDNYINETYSNITIEHKQMIWTVVSNQMLTENSDRLIEIINSYLSVEGSLGTHNDTYI